MEAIESHHIVKMTAHFRTKARIFIPVKRISSVQKLLADTFDEISEL